jgi:hypothetical protein
MTLANMRLNGVRMVTASCEACGHKADVNVDLLPDTLTVPEAGRRLRCSACGAKTISTRPAWHTGSQRPGTPDYRRERPPLSYAVRPASSPARRAPPRIARALSPLHSAPQARIDRPVDKLRASHPLQLPRLQSQGASRVRSPCWSNSACPRSGARMRAEASGQSRASGTLPARRRGLERP